MFDLLEKPELRPRLAKRSRKLALKYDYGRMLKSYEHVLEQGLLEARYPKPAHRSGTSVKILSVVGIA